MRGSCNFWMSKSGREAGDDRGQQEPHEQHGTNRSAFAFPGKRAGTGTDT